MNFLFYCFDNHTTITLIDSVDIKSEITVLSKLDGVTFLLVIN